MKWKINEETTKLIAGNTRTGRHMVQHLDSIIIKVNWETKVKSNIKGKPGKMK